jgi:hypothetical protein
MDSPYYFNICVFKMDTNGVVVWIKEQAVMNTNDYEVNSKIAVDSVGNLYISYQTPGTVSGGTLSGGSDIVVFKMDNTGTVIWIKEQTLMNTSGADTVPAITVTPAGGIYVSYQTAGTVSSGTDTDGATEDIVVFQMLQTSTSAIPITVPGAPTSLVATLDGAGSASIAFTAGATGGSAITNYTYSTNNGQAYTACSPVQLLGPIAISGLTTGTTYTIKIRAVNAAGDGTESTGIFINQYALLNTVGVSEMTMWFDAADTSTITDVSGVTNWANKSGSVMAAQSVSTTTNPTRTTLNNLNVLNFGANVMKTNANVAWSSSFTMFIVAKALAGYFIIASNNEYVFTGNWHLITIRNQFNTDDSVIARGTPVVAANTWFIFAIGYNSTSTSAVNYTINGTSRASTVVNGLGGSITNTLPITINGNYNGVQDTSQVAEIILYNQSVTTDQRQQVEGCLAWKWGLQASLPATHPYSTINVDAPTALVATPGNGTARIAFTPQARGYLAITNYAYSIDNGTNYNLCGPVQLSGPIIITGLTNGTAYTVKIRAVFAASNGVASASISVTPRA